MYVLRSYAIMSRKGTAITSAVHSNLHGCLKLGWIRLFNFHLSSQKGVCTLSYVPALHIPHPNDFDSNIMASYIVSGGPGWPYTYVCRSQEVLHQDHLITERRKIKPFLYMNHNVKHVHYFNMIISGGITAGRFPYVAHFVDPNT